MSASIHRHNFSLNCSPTHEGSDILYRRHIASKIYRAARYIAPEGHIARLLVSATVIGIAYTLGPSHGLLDVKTVFALFLFIRQKIKDLYKKKYDSREEGKPPSFKNPTSFRMGGSFCASNQGFVVWV